MDGLRLFVPEWETIDPAALIIAVLAFLALFRFKWGMIRTLLLGAAIGMLYYLVVLGVTGATT